MAESLDSYFLFPEGGEASELGFTPSAEVLGRYPIDLSTGLATLQPPQDQGPAISDLERIAYAAPTPPRIDFTPPPVLGTYQPPQPVTPAAAPPRVSYAAPAPVRIDMTPMLNAGLATFQQPQAPAPTPSLASPMSFAAPSAVRVEPTPAPEPEPEPSSAPVFSDYQTKPIVAANIGTTLDPTTEERYNVIGVGKEDKETITPAPVSGIGGGAPDIKVEQLTPKETEELLGTQTPTESQSTPGVVVTPGTEIQKEVSQYVPARVIIDPIKYDPFPISEFQFTEPAPVTPINRQPGRLIPTLKPVDIELPMRRAVERLAPGIFRDINYDPELILEAAMRSLGPRYAKQSLLEEQRMFERMK